MPVLHLVLGVLVAVLFLLAAALGAWRWWRVEPSPLFWRLLRGAQAVLLVEVVVGGVLLALGHSSPGELHLVYGLLPVLVSFMAEQLRISSADAVLAARGHESAQAVGALPATEQQSVALAIVRREIGVMTLGAVTILALLVRASITS